MKEQTINRENFGNNFLTFLKSRAPLAYIETPEINEVKKNICAIQRSKKIYRSIFYYSAEGDIDCLYLCTGKRLAEAKEAAATFNKQPRNKECPTEEFIRRITTETKERDPSFSSIPPSSILIASGISSFLEDARLCSQLMEAITSGFFVENRITLILVDISVELPEKLLSYATAIPFGLPDEKELRDLFTLVKQQLLSERPQVKKASIECWFDKEDIVSTLIQATKGMTLLEAETCYRLCLNEVNILCPKIEDILYLVYKQKQQLIYKSTALHFIPEDELPEMKFVGGLDYPKYYLRLKAPAFLDPSLNLDMPKGIVLKGPSGCGKSMLAKASGKLFRLPVVELEMGAIFNAYIGVSENQIKRELERIDAFNGCVLLIDEADKAFAGCASDSGSDSGVVMRVFGIILKWLQERKSKTFVILTVNNDKDLPPELLRCGRFDKVFTVELPTDIERKAIIASHLYSREIPTQITPAEANEILHATVGMTGAQLEAVVVESRFVAYNRRKETIPTLEDMLYAVKLVKN